MYHFLFFLFWGSLGLAILAIALTLFVPKYRKQLKIQSQRATLEERYAKEIASGEAVIISKDPTALKKLIFLIACGGILVLLIQKFKLYISSLQQTCTDVYGWNSIFVHIAGLSTVGSILLLIVIVSMYKDYQKIINDGYTPSRKSKQPQDRIAFKLTKRLKIKEQLRLVVFVIGCIFIMSMPFQILHILVNISPKKSISIYELNDHLQKSCLDDLKKDSVKPLKK